MSNRVKALVAVLLLGAVVYHGAQKNSAGETTIPELGPTVASLGELVATADLTEEEWAEIAACIDAMMGELNG